MRAPAVEVVVVFCALFGASDPPSIEEYDRLVGGCACAAELSVEGVRGRLEAILGSTGWGLDAICPGSCLRGRDSWLSFIFELAEGVASQMSIQEVPVQVLRPMTRTRSIIHLT